MHSDILKSGFVPNEDKSQWEPILIITWLPVGVILNTIDGSIKATDERIATLSRDLENLSTYQNPMRVRVKRVASVAGWPNYFSLKLRGSCCTYYDEISLLGDQQCCFLGL